jgi:predicted small lipoprotein YifL
MSHSRISFAALLLIFSFVGCGQSGPLYLPGDPSEVQSLPDHVPELSEDDDDDDDEERGTENDGG